MMPSTGFPALSCTTPLICIGSPGSFAGAIRALQSIDPGIPSNIHSHPSHGAFRIGSCFVAPATRMTTARRSVFISSGLHRERVAHSCSLQHDGPVSRGHARLELGDRFVVAHTRYTDFARNGVTGTHRRAKGPVDLEKHRAGPRQIFGHNGVENRARHTSLHHNAAKARRAGRFFIIVERIAIAADLGKELDITSRDESGTTRSLTDGWFSPGPSGHCARFPANKARTESRERITNVVTPSAVPHGISRHARAAVR